ncbi:MAG: D-alanyl-D-alanine carboxypeptidase [Alicyclobacillus sp.]|nr:D-alanyl-D-alanine carboxypeptidase [Alicyclobacillus sp.]
MSKFLHSWRIIGRSLSGLGLVMTSTLQVAHAKSAPQHHALSDPVVVGQQMVDGVPIVPGQVPGAPAITAEAAVVMDMATGTLVYAKNPLAEHYPASITKIMTALLALEHGHLTDRLTASALAANQPADRLDLVPGEVEPLEPLLYALLLYSANDAAVEIAQHYGGSVRNFARMMNAKARALGAHHTHFVNPNGLPDPRHVTTAYDMALIARAAMQIPEFRKIVATRSYPWHGLQWQTTLYNINRMLTSYPGAIGVKTGYTSVAHETLVVAATHGSQTFLAVLLDDPTDWEIRQDATNLLNFAFAHYHTVTVLPAHERVHATLQGKPFPVPVSTSSKVLSTVPVGSHMQVASHVELRLPQSPIRPGIEVGQLVLSSQGHTIGEVPLVSRGTWLPVPRRPHDDPFDVTLFSLLLLAIGSMTVYAFRPRRRMSRVPSQVRMGRSFPYRTFD